FSSRRRHTRWPRDWSSDVCSSDLNLSNYSSESIGKNSKDCAPVRGQIATNRITNSRCGSNQSQDAVKSDGRCLWNHGFIEPNTLKIANCKMKTANCSIILITNYGSPSIYILHFAIFNLQFSFSSSLPRASANQRHHDQDGLQHKHRRRK